MRFRTTRISLFRQIIRWSHLKKCNGCSAHHLLKTNKVKKFLSYAIPFVILASWYYFRYHVAPEIDDEAIQVYNEQGALVPVWSLQNGPVLLNFYAAWCGHCMQEMEALERAHQRKQFTVIGLTDDEPGKCSNF